MARVIAAFVATLPLVFLTGNDDPSSLPQSVWLQVGVALLWLLRLLSPRPLGLRLIGRALAPWVLFLAWSALSLAWSTDSYAAQKVLLRWFAAFGLALLVADIADSLTAARSVLLALFWSCLAVSCIGLLQHFRGLDFVPQAFPPAGTLGNKNLAAEVVMAGAAAGVFAFFRWSQLGRLTVITLGLGSVVAFVYHTSCRGAWIAAVAQAVTAAVWWMSGRFQQPWTVPRGVALAAGVFWLWILVSVATPWAGARQEGISELVQGAVRPITDLLGSESEEADIETAGGRGGGRPERSVNLRLKIWRNTTEMLRETPVRGVGLGNFSVQYPRFSRRATPDGTQIDERVDAPHNDYVQLAAELGLIGVVLAGWSLWALVRAARTALKRAGAEHQRVVLSSGLGLLALLVAAVVSPLFTQPAPLVAFATLAGLILGRTRVVEREGAAPESSEPSSMTMRPCGLGIATAAAVVAASSGFGQIRADQHVLRMGHAEVREEWGSVVEEGLAARHFDPRRVDTRFAPASAMLRLGDARGATALLLELTEADPHNANALGNLAVAYMNQGHLEQAALALRRVLTIRPDDRLALSWLNQINQPNVRGLQ